MQMDSKMLFFFFLFYFDSVIFFFYWTDILNLYEPQAVNLSIFISSLL